MHSIVHYLDEVRVKGVLSAQSALEYENDFSGLSYADSRLFLIHLSVFNLIFVSIKLTRDQCSAQFTNRAQMSTNGI